MLKLRKCNKVWTKILTFLSLIALGSHLIHLFMIWSDIPDHIAIHFSKGEPDNWGTKYFLLITPAIGLLVWWLLGILTKYPEKFNYINLTDKNRDRQYKMASKIFTIIQNLTLLTFIFANEHFLRSAIDTDQYFFHLLFIISLVLLPLILLYNVIWAAILKD